MAKLFAAERVVHVITQCAQILGAYGYSRNHPLERYLRQARMLSVIDGTSQIQKIVISRSLLQ